MSAERHSDPELRLLLEDYAKPRPRAAAAPLPPSDQPLHLLLEDYWSSRPQPPPGTSLPVVDGPAPGFLVEDFDPVRRYWDRRGDQPPPVVPIDAPLEFEVAWDRSAATKGNRTRAISVGAHGLVALFLIVQPYTPRPEPTEPDGERDYTTIALVAPSQETLEGLTRSAPGRLQENLETPPPRELPPTPQPTPPKPAPRPAETDEPEVAVPQPIETPEPEPEPEPAIVEKPKPEPPEQVARVESQSPAPGPFERGRRPARDPRTLPAPKAPSTPKPKLELEDPKARMPSKEAEDIQVGGVSIAPRPGSIVEAAVQNLARGGGGGRQAVGDGVAANGEFAPPSPGNIGSGLELLSDPKGVDFRPYLIQILNSVRRNWHAVLPESARLGMKRGRVAIQFIVAKDGSVPKLVIADTSADQTLDRAAVAGISASNPFPPLPGEFSGNEIRLQFVFLYNMR